jgi:hypothetical protein
MFMHVHTHTNTHTLTLLMSKIIISDQTLNSFFKKKENRG